MAPDILNWQEGVARVVNNRGLYAKLLGRFIDSLGDTLEKITVALADNNTEEAIRLAHTLKGTSANLGAYALAEVSGTLEQVIKAESDITVAFEETKKILEDTLDSMRAFEA